MRAVRAGSGHRQFLVILLQSAVQNKKPLPGAGGHRVGVISPGEERLIGGELHHPSRSCRQPKGVRHKDVHRRGPGPAFTDLSGGLTTAASRLRNGILDEVSVVPLSSDGPLSEGRLVVRRANDATLDPELTNDRPALNS